MFVPHTNDTIIPNHELGGGGTTIINVSGGSYPVETQAAVRRGMSMAYSAAVRDTAKLQGEK